MALSSRSIFSTPVLVTILALFAALAFAGVYTVSNFSCHSYSEAAPAYHKVHHQTVIVSAPEAVATPQQDAVTNEGFLGLVIRTVDARTIHQTPITTVVPGVLVVHTLDDFSAYETGFAQFDIVTHINNQRVLTADQMKSMVSSSEPGTRIPVTVVRDGVKVNLYPTLDAKPAKFNVYDHVQAQQGECPYLAAKRAAHQRKVEAARRAGVTECPYLAKKRAWHKRQVEAAKAKGVTECPYLAKKRELHKLQVQAAKAAGMTKCPYQK